MQENAALFAVVVNWNLKEDTIACAASLFEAGIGPGNLIVVDNGSTDGSVPALASRFGDGLQNLEAGDNLGFTGGVNLGIRAALDQGAEWVLLVNNDTVVDVGMVAELLGAAEKQGFRMAGPTIFYHSDPRRVWFFGHRLVGGTLFTRGVPRPDSETGIQAVDFLSGCGMLVHREVFEAAGLFDTSLFMYGEEVDFCWRARLAGYRPCAVAGAKMWHKVSASASRDKPATRRIRVRNQVWFYRRYGKGFQKPVHLAGSLARFAALALRDVFQGESRLAAAHWRGWWEGWSEKAPEYPANTRL